MKNEISIVLSGEAGQGIKTVEKLLIHSLRDAGYHFFSTSELMSRVRGGNNTTEIRIGGKNIRSFTEKIDLLFAVGKNALSRLGKRIDKNTIIVGEERFIPENYRETNEVHIVPFMQIATETGGLILTNTVVLGYIFGALGFDKTFGETRLKLVFGKKGEEIGIKLPPVKKNDEVYIIIKNKKIKT